MQQLSSSWTLLFKIFLPTFWLTFFGIFTLALWITNYEYYGAIPGGALRLGVTLFYFLGCVFLYFTVFQLKRVEADAENLYVTNYFKNVKIPFPQVDTFEEIDFLIFKIITVRLREPSSFGNSLKFIPSTARFAYFLESNTAFAKKGLSSSS
jgi:hypothetical protein